MTIHGCKDMSALQEINRGLVDLWQVSAAQEEQQKEFKRMVRSATICMTAREHRVVNFFFGVLGKEMSFEEIGLKMGISTVDVEKTFISGMKRAQRDADERASWIREELKQVRASTHNSDSVH